MHVTLSDSQRGVHADIGSSNKLNGCINDSNCMVHLLKTRFGFHNDGILQMTGKLSCLGWVGRTQLLAVDSLHSDLVVTPKLQIVPCCKHKCYKASAMLSAGWCKQWILKACCMLEFASCGLQMRCRTPHGCQQATTSARAFAGEAGCPETP